MTRAMRYRVIDKIAHGGMAEIYLAMQLGAEGFQKPVVLKRILPAFAADPSFVRMLVDEAHIASNLHHGNLVQVLDLRKSDDQYFLVLEFVDGWSLEQVRRRAKKAKLKMPLPVTLTIVGALCRALAYVHTRTRNGKPLGIVHRDVTPQNVLLSREGEVKLADFGIAKAVGRREKSATGVIKGKFAYMSPEQTMGLELDAQSDLFSVGTLTYLLTTGRKPFEGATDLDVILQVRSGRYDKPSTFIKDFNPDVERFIARALRVPLSRRWQTAEQMADRIDAILAKLGQPAGPAVLKRWLDTLASRDGVKTPGELGELTESAGTIELGSRDLELQEVAVPPVGNEGEPVSLAGTARVDDSWAPGESLERGAGDRRRPGERPPAAGGRTPARGTADGDAAPISPLASVAPMSPEQAPLPGLTVRFGRWLRRTTIRVVVLVAVIVAAAYFARPHLPPWMAGPMNSWLRRLPPPIGNGTPPETAPP